MSDDQSIEATLREVRERLEKQCRASSVDRTLNICEAYLRDEHVESIGDRFYLAPSSVYATVSRCGVKRPPSQLAERDRAVCEAYARTDPVEPVESIAQRFGVSPGSVYEIAARGGVRRRRSGLRPA